VVSVAWGEWAVEYFRDNDPKQFVLDEFAGQWVALLVLPASLTAETWAFVLVAGGQFVLFRIFDIIKPPPARQAERLPAGWGILTDDLFAGLYANLVGQLLWRATPLASWLGLHLATTHAAGG
jgi:phosphatidylglycerophosphatase A